MLAFYVALGGALGSLLRFAVGRLAEAQGLTAFPAATLFVNVVGSFLLGVLATAGEGKTLGGHDLRAIVGTGVLGGFTTYSTFNLESVRLLQQGDYGRSALYVTLTLALAFAGGAVGMRLGRVLAS